jgi:comEA protein
MKLTGDQKYGLLFLAAMLLFFSGEQIITGLFFAPKPVDFHKSDSLFFALTSENSAAQPLFFTEKNPDSQSFEGNAALNGTPKSNAKEKTYHNKKQPLTEKININTASKEELIRLPNIGPKTADKIIEYRNRHGKFLTIEDIKQIKGIGDKRFQALRDFIVVE